MHKITRLTNEQFIERCINKFGPDAYDYSEVKYRNQYAPVKVKCLTCGRSLSVIPYKFLAGNGCSHNDDIGYNKRIPRYTTETFIKKAEEKYGVGTYGYDQVDYKNTYTKIKIWCPTCQEYFEILPSSFLYKDSNIGCPKCNQRLAGQAHRTPQDEWIARAKEKWGDACDYTDTVYTGTKNRVRIYCNEHHGYFEQLPSVHLNSSYPCPQCSFKHTATESIGEKNIRLVLESFGIVYDQEHFVIGEIEGRNRDQVRIDFSFEYQGQKYWIEYNGEQHYHFISFFSHGDPEWLEKQVKRDENIRDYAVAHGIELITIPYTYREYDDLLVAITDILVNHQNNIIIPEIDYGNRR